MSLAAGNTKSPEKQQPGAKQREMDDIIDRLSREIEVAEDVEKRLRDIEERLSGQIPSEADLKEEAPPYNYVPKLNHCIERLGDTNIKSRAYLEHIESVI